MIYGIPKYEYGKLSFPSCEIEIAKSNRRELVPVYSDLNYIPGTWIREKIVLLQSYIARTFTDNVPHLIREKHGFRSKAESVKSIHFPSSMEEFEQAKQEL